MVLGQSCFSFQLSGLADSRVFTSSLTVFYNCACWIFYVRIRTGLRVSLRSFLPYNRLTRGSGYARYLIMPVVYHRRKGLSILQMFDWQIFWRNIAQTFILIFVKNRETALSGGYGLSITASCCGCAFRESRCNRSGTTSP